MTHPLVVRVAHWINTAAFFGLLVSGAAILIAHPRLYWGDTGTVGAPSLIDLPLPFVFGHSGWGRSLHFLSAWICVINGLVYAVFGLLTHHFTGGFRVYSALQRRVYAAVVFAVLPLGIWSGLAMSPSITSVFPWMVTLLGGQQSARTIHFAVTVMLVLFVAGHVAMVWMKGFAVHVRAMIANSSVASEQQS